MACMMVSTMINLYSSWPITVPPQPRKLVFPHRKKKEKKRETFFIPKNTDETRILNNGYKIFSLIDVLFETKIE